MLKKRIIIITSIILVFITGFIVLNYMKNSDQETGNSKTSALYVVKNFNGKIAIFEKESIEPFKITEIPVSYLPEKDQENLNKGIEAFNFEELKHILEDYCG